jgi:RNA-directed DNA polymerase
MRGQTTPVHRTQPEKFRITHSFHPLSGSEFEALAKRKNCWKEKSRPLVQQLLPERGLELSPTKTVVTPVTQGLDFLGRIYSNGKLLIKPAKKNVKRFLSGIRRIIKAAPGKSAADLINELNPKKVVRLLGE